MCKDILGLLPQSYNNNPSSDVTTWGCSMSCCIVGIQNQWFLVPILSMNMSMIPIYSWFISIYPSFSRWFIYNVHIRDVIHFIQWLESNDPISTPAGEVIQDLGWSSMITVLIIRYWLVVDKTPLKNMKVNWDDYEPNIWENKKCSKPPTRW